MPHFLLIGAGFTRNWGGPLSDEVTGSLLGDLHDDAELAAALRKGPFEDAFQGFQRPAGSARISDGQRRFRDAVTNLFTRLNLTLLEVPFEFSDDERFSIRNFLARFDAIFSLNQDLLLEIHYQPDVAGRGKWSEVVVPGMRSEPPPPGNDHYGAFGEYWVPIESVDIPPTSQPFVKLHGSTNWHAASGEPILIMGNAKSGAIQKFEVLQHYHALFSSSLNQPKGKLMVIGYGFQDDHINNVIEGASRRYGLGTFLVDPRGRDALLDPRMALADIKPKREIEGIKLIGELRRPLSAVFSGDRFAHEDLCGSSASGSLACGSASRASLTG